MHRPTRRTYTIVAAGALVVALAACALLWAHRPQQARADDPIKVGVLHSLTGSVAIAERPINDATLLAIDELNERGGLLGRRVQPVIVDGRSDWPAFGAGAERLLTRDGVSAVFGCYTSASRKQVVPIFEKHHGVLFYPTFYEGIESSPNVVYTGAAPNQSSIPAVKWFLENRGRKVFLVGSDYIYPRATNAVLRAQIAYLGGKVLGERYVPLGSSDTADAVRAIAAAKPDVIVSTMVGDSNIPFFKELRAAGITPRSAPVLNLVIGEVELQSLSSRTMAGDYIALNYFQSLDHPANRRFVAAFKKRYGAHRAIADSMEAAYTSVHLWAQAVREAGSADAAAVLEAVPGQSYDAPEGQVYVDEHNLHTWKTARIGQIRPDGQVTVVWASEALIHPMPYSIFRTRRHWEELVSSLYTRWGHSWQAPPPKSPNPPTPKGG
ncbi:urea ABC transporter substrate-binding protein [Streptomyces sp. NPDC059009]|uniref:urea ABC transporter substrate-binding protein n=1 Tax=Streptomyces sp. NPDC059009 TaxID=3346694 RepID=UPI0036A11AEA